MDHDSDKMIQDYNADLHGDSVDGYEIINFGAITGGEPQPYQDYDGTSVNRKDVGLGKFSKGIKIRSVELRKLSNGNTRQSHLSSGDEISLDEFNSTDRLLRSVQPKAQSPHIDTELEAVDPLVICQRNISSNATFTLTSFAAGGSQESKVDDAIQDINKDKNTKIKGSGKRKLPLYSQPPSDDPEKEKKRRKACNTQNAREKAAKKMTDLENQLRESKQKNTNLEQKNTNLEQKITNLENQLKDLQETVENQRKDLQETVEEDRKKKADLESKLKMYEEIISTGTTSQNSTNDTNTHMHHVNGRDNKYSLKSHEWEVQLEGMKSYAEKISNGDPNLYIKTMNDLFIRNGISPINVPT